MHWRGRVGVLRHRIVPYSPVRLYAYSKMTSFITWPHLRGRGDIGWHKTFWILFYTADYELKETASWDFRPLVFFNNYTPRPLIRGLGAVDLWKKNHRSKILWDCLFKIVWSKRFNSEVFQHFYIQWPGTCTTTYAYGFIKYCKILYLSCSMT
jgi:hypothetical protein